MAFVPVAGACAAVAHGVGAVVASAAAHVVVATIVLALERARPCVKAWSVPQGDLKVDLAHLVVGSVLGGAAWRVVAAALLAVLIGGGRGPWPGAWPVALQIALGVVVVELGQYAMHRAMHRVAWLWPFHAVHHSVRRLHLPSAFRNHPVDVVLTFVVPLAPLLALGASEDVIVLTTCAIGVHSLVQHANVDFAHGAADAFFATARAHRRHHARDVEESASNYGGTVLVWDAVFGTRRRGATATAEPGEVGLGVPSLVPATYAGQLLVPFRRVLARGRLDTRLARQFR